MAECQQNRDINHIEQTRVAIVGGGIAGATVALCLSELGMHVDLLEKGPSLVNGPPICHLHAGGNLYREISEEQCVTLLIQSVDLLRLYPYAADYRPTIIAIPTDDSGSPEALLPRLEKLQAEYKRLIDENPLNKVLGDSDDYYRLFSREEVESLAQLEPLEKPQTLAQWMIPMAKNVDLDKLKFPLVMVQEFGLNVFRLAASVSLALESNPDCDIHTGSKVSNIVSHSQAGHWEVNYQQMGQDKTLQCDYLINAAGFRSGTIDDLLGFKRQRLVEFKAAYVCKWDDCDYLWPEIIFHGERGTPKGMGQFTPYPGGYFQLHGMTNNITLFENGLVESNGISAQPQLASSFIHKIDEQWTQAETTERTRSAIEHLVSYLPKFESAEVASKPLFGAQQIPGEDPTLRAADVSFVGDRYARCEIVKASSVLTVADAIIEQLVLLGCVDKADYGNREFAIMNSISEADIDQRAELLVTQREYPLSLAGRNVPQL